MRCGMLSHEVSLEAAAPAPAPFHCRTFRLPAAQKTA